MTQQRGSFQDSLEKLPSYDEQLHNPSGAVSSWSGAAAAKRVTDLTSMLCMNCGIDFDRQTAGYDQLPQTSPVTHGYRRPYIVEKRPSVQISTSASFSSTNIDLGSPIEFCHDSETDMTSPPLNSFPMIPETPQLAAPLAAPLVLSNNSSQDHGLPAPPDYYMTQPLKQEPELPSASLITANPTSLPYGSDLVPLGDPQALSQPGMAAIPAIPSYGTAGVSLSPILHNGWSEVPLLDDGAIDIYLNAAQRGGKRGPFKDAILREQTAHTRKIGSCIRCRMQRIRCEANVSDPDGACLTCKKVVHARVSRFPCLRYKIMDIKMYKPGQVPGFEWTRRWNNNISDSIQNWASSEIKTIYISENLARTCMSFRVRKFIPQDGDKLERTWVYNGTQRSVNIPPYALVSLEEGKAAYINHINNCMPGAFKTILQDRGCGPMLYRTYMLAYELAHDLTQPKECRDLLNRTLRLWVAIRLSSRSIFIVGDEKLGMHKNILDETNQDCGKIPIPPVLGAQTDVILIHHIQTKLRRDLLDQLQKMFHRNKPNTWLATYLVTFILLHNGSLITRHDASYARKHGMNRRFAREDKVQEYFLGCNVLLAYFHYCNKGIYPFSEACKDQELRNLAELDDAKISFVRDTRLYARHQKQVWEQLHNQAAYEDDFFFVSQLFAEFWQPLPGT